MNKFTRRHRRAQRVRRNISRLQTQRLCVHRTPRHIYAQIIDASGGRVLASASTVEAEVRKELGNGGNVAAASLIGKRIAESFNFQRLDHRLELRNDGPDALRALSGVPPRRGKRRERHGTDRAEAAGRRSGSQDDDQAALPPGVLRVSRPVRRRSQSRCHSRRRRPGSLACSPRSTAVGS